jgi:hypothetical protein
MNWFSHIDRRVFAAVPATRLAALRILVGSFSTIYLLARSVHLTTYRGGVKAFEPVGVVNLLSEPLPAALVIVIYALCVVFSLCATLGYRYRVSGPLWGLGLLWVLCYRNSWGMLFHTENLLVLYALVLMFAPAADAWSMDARNREAASKADTRYAWPVRTLGAILVTTYVVAGVAKLRAVGLNWIDGEQLRSHIAFDALRKIELGSVHSPLGVALVRHPGWLVPFSWLSLVLELGAPLALFGKRLAWIWTLLAWAFHAGVLATMAIFFPFPLLGVAFAPLFAVEVLFERALIPAWARVWTKPRAA